VKNTDKPFVFPIEFPCFHSMQVKTNLKDQQQRMFV
jgi:hypothetical protein